MTNVDAFDLLATSVFLLNERGHIEYANAAAEDLFGRSRKQLRGLSAATLFDNPEDLQSAIDSAAAGKFADVRQLASLRRVVESVEVTVTTVSLSGQAWPVLIETREIEQRVLADRNQRLVDEIESHRELLRNLAHEVKNPWAACAARPSCWKPSCPARPWPNIPRSSSPRPTGCRRWSTG